jgi:hypothetical protein
MSKYTDLRRACAEAQERFAAYHAECVHFAGAFTRAIMEDFGWPRELVRFGDGSAEHPELVMRLDAEGYWELPVALLVKDGDFVDTLSFQLRFRRSGDEWELQLFRGVELEVPAPTRDALAPALELLHRAIRAHYEQGLTHFLEGRSARLYLPYVPKARAAAPAPQKAPRG